MGPDKIKFADPMGMGEFPSILLAVFAEAGCSVLIIAGLFTRAVAIPPAITMIVAACIVHASDPFAKKELPLLYLLIYLVILTLGAGKYSLDRLIQQKQEAA
jgi:putative oxidoreductase